LPKLHETQNILFFKFIQVYIGALFTKMADVKPTFYT